ncbi:zinc ABC transporter substrate-binding protein [Pseudodesulfovibrio sp. zrk46]|uniref:metal ABC transporter solute-binding protein, Zn/Mn family n=1 Tax=Pseudodesulfovibrio sp. zrk46 TaxID=2725288 RepID=UPI0014490DD0|nr:zinc ABC transporter substrate-binding protein [Pseudodesulfovibrio sp. zrk46]QJB57210.1 zinc ABC transporter solute-binding protein [Pseudodesulfovibrio sp. zrk46]
MKKWKSIYWISLTLCLLLAPATAAMAKPIVFVSIVPQLYFVDRIAGDLVDTRVLVKPNANPHMYEPTPSQMAALSKAKAYFAIGITLEEAWLPRINGANPSLRIVSTQEGIKKIPMATHEGHADKHEHEEHEHGTLDPHIWLDPVRAQTIARNTCQGLIKADPQNKNTYEANLAALLSEIKNTDNTITKIMHRIPSDKRSFLVFHPSWGYFADRYNLNQMAIEAEGKEPGPKDLAQIIKLARENGIKVIFVAPQFSQKAARVIANEINAQVVPLDPLSEDWENNLLKAAQAFEASLN